MFLVQEEVYLKKSTIIAYRVEQYHAFSHTILKIKLLLWRSYNIHHSAKTTATFDRINNNRPSWISNNFIIINLCVCIKWFHQHGKGAHCYSR